MIYNQYLSILLSLLYYHIIIMLLKVDCLPVGKQPSIPLINLGRKWTLNWWWLPYYHYHYHIIQYSILFILHYNQFIPYYLLSRDGVSLKTPRPRGWVGAGRPSGCKSSFNKRNMYQYPHVSQLFILLPWQSRVYPEPLKVVEFVQLTTECCWGQPSDPCQRGCLTSHACVMWGPRTLNADDDDDDDHILSWDSSGKQVWILVKRWF